MPSKVFVESLGQWRDVNRQYTFVTNQWRLVQRSYVNVNGVWKLGFARTPGTPNNVVLLVNGSSSTTQTATSSPISALLSWSVDTDDSTLPVTVQWYENYVASGSPVQVYSGTSTENSFVLNAGQTKAIGALVKIRNGVNPPVSEDVFGMAYYAGDIAVTWPSASVSNVQLSANVINDRVTVAWTATDPPSGAYYEVVWYDNVNNTTSQSAGTVSASPLNITSLSGEFPGHGYDLVSFGSNTVTFYATVTMYTSNGVEISSASGSNTFYRADDI